MTTLCYSMEEKAFIADGRETDGNGKIITDNANKIQDTEFYVLALAGDVEVIEYVINHWPEINADDVLGNCQGFVYSKEEDVVHTFSLHNCNDKKCGGHVHFCKTTCTEFIGSGEDFALGAYRYGSSPFEAVTTALLCDSKSGGEVVKVHLRPLMEDNHGSDD